jgi:LysM repeat protein
VKQGDTLAAVAKTYRTTPKAILAANHLEDEELPADRKLIIPVPAGKHAIGEDVQNYARRTTRYRVRQGDTVQKVADNFGVSPTMVRRWNHLKGNSVAGRRILYIHLPVTKKASEIRLVSAPATHSKKKVVKAVANNSVRHKVKAGETLYSIASTHHTTVDALKRDNGDLAILRPGMILLIRDVR